MDTPPLLQYPCDYPIKVMARASPQLRATLDAILARHGGPTALAHVTERPSKQAHFIGVTYVIQAQGEGQIAALFAELKTCPAVLMVI